MEGGAWMNVNNRNNRNAEHKRTNRKGNSNPKPPMRFGIINAKTYKILNTLNPNAIEAKEAFHRKPFYCK